MVLSTPELRKNFIPVVLIVGATLCVSSVLRADGLQSHPTFRHLQELRGDDDDNVEELSVEVSFEEILKTVIFLMTSWVFAVLSKMMGLPSLVGEITTGFIMGPPGLDFVAFPEAMVLIGSFGLIGLLLDSGINLDIAQLRETGSRAVLMAVTGTILALSVGIGMGHWLLADSSDMKASMAIGAAFAPSSFGVASQVLAKGEVLNTPMGQVIVAASVVDDILGLILLSIMQVLVQDSPEIFEYILPFVSSFGYLIVLGFVGIKIIPNLVENVILPKFNEEKRNVVGFALLFILLAIYLPVLNYSGASYLTGAFLAGLSFSQIHSVHSTYLESGPHLKIWLMRIFFAATIGFQVPVRYFTEGVVLNWGFLYLVPVIAKLPLGLLVPHMQRDIPDDFPYDPYWKDVITTSLAMLCRGEFNFIVASFALGAGVVDSEKYAAIVFAILLSAVFAPLALSQVLRYYNDKFRDYIQGRHKIDRLGDTSDGVRPMFLAIQARTPVTWGIQEKFKLALEKAGLIIMDHRSWHTLGLNSVDITEIFTQDSILQVRIRRCFASGNSFATKNSSHSSSEDEDEDASKGTNLGKTLMEKDTHDLEISAEIPAIEEDMRTEDLEVATHTKEMEEDRREKEAMESRKAEIRAVLAECLGEEVDPSEYVIKVSLWEPFVSDDGNQRDRSPSSYRFVFDDHADADRPSSPLRNSSRHISAATMAELGLEEPHLEDSDLWDIDTETRDLARSGYFMTGTEDGACPIMLEGCHETHNDAVKLHHRRNHSACLDDFVHDLEADTIKDRLHGYVRP